MKIAGYGQAKVLSKTELQTLFTEGLKKDRDRAIFAICFFTACRISECLALEKADFLDDRILFRKAITKGQLASREIIISPDLELYLARYQSPRFNPYFFPGRGGHFSRISADQLFKKACEKVNIRGASTHSMRRTALTMMHRAGIPLRDIQAISGHHSLAALARYLEVSDENKQRAIASLGWQ